LANVSEGMEHRIGDINDFDLVLAAFTEAEPEIVLHMAAQSLVRQSYADPLGTFATNIIGTAHVLEACRRVDSVRSVVIVTSDKCYDNKGWVRGYRENDPLGGDDPYSASKGAAELVAHSYRSAFFSSSDAAGVATARAGNVIGGGDWSADRLLPDFFRAATQGKPLRIRNPSAIRPWQFVLEPLRGYLLLAEQLFSGAPGAQEAWNFGPRAEDSRSVVSVAERLKTLWPEPVAVEIDDSAHPKESAVLKLDCSKAEARLGWLSFVGLERCLELTTSWHLNIWRDPAAARRCTLEQIAAYEASTSAFAKGAEAQIERLGVVGTDGR
jgi:CDP-glucose 4,6-dehydratase